MKPKTNVFCLKLEHLKESPTFILRMNIQKFFHYPWRLLFRKNIHHRINEPIEKIKF